jgi:hypothetical protein
MSKSIQKRLYERNIIFNNPDELVTCKDYGAQMLKENNNVDLENYATHIGEFKTFSEHLFPPDDNFFINKKGNLLARKEQESQGIPQR